MKIRIFESLDSFFYCFLKLIMWLLKYILILVILVVAGFIFLGVVNKIWLESFAWINREIKARTWWNILKNILIIISIIPFVITIIFSILSIIKNKLYLQRKKYIGRLIAFIFIWPIILLPIIIIGEDKKPEYRRYRLTLYFYSILIFIQASRFIWAALWDILTILVTVFTSYPK